MRPLRTLLVAALYGAATVASGAALAADSPTGPVTIKPPEMTIPTGAKRGGLRRIIQPFGPWTLICDENLRLRKRVCNASQILVDAGGRTVFSWSLAASEGGAPVFIVRLPMALSEDHFAQVIFDPQKPVVAGVVLASCDAATCIGFLPVNKKIQQRIAEGVNVIVRVKVGSTEHTFDATLDGLKEAVASLK